LVLNPPSGMVLQPNDKVLVIGSIPVKGMESFLLLHRMKKKDQNALSIRQERRQMAIEALQAKLAKRDRNLVELQKELLIRTSKYT